MEDVEDLEVDAEEPTPVATVELTSVEIAPVVRTAEDVSLTSTVKPATSESCLPSSSPPPFAWAKRVRAPSFAGTPTAPRLLDGEPTKAKLRLPPRTPESPTLKRSSTPLLLLELLEPLLPSPTPRPVSVAMELLTFPERKRRRTTPSRTTSTWRRKLLLSSTWLLSPLRDRPTKVPTMTNGKTPLPSPRRDRTNLTGSSVLRLV